MKVHLLEREQRVPLDVDQTFRFFGEIENLERITPPWLRFRILDPRPDKLTAGARLEYSLILHRFPIRWTTAIDEWEPPGRFTDFQVRGPYALWQHTHTFAPVEGGTLVTDEVRYAIPYGPLGALAHVAFVRRDLRRIFDYRRDTVAALLDSGTAG
ncbi:MAG TPA: SRPBCC family protein [Solirubrobacterales bacterium]|nr:SRPBCC family protein [Solirubrobacterales bacterium]